MFRKFWADRRGSYTISFGLMCLTLCVAAGGMTDMMRLIDTRSKLRDAVDATALFVAQQHRNSETQSRSDTDVARDYMTRIFDAKSGTLGTVSAAAAANSVTVTAAASLDTYFLTTLSLASLSTTAASTATWASTSIEIALVLDNTGSMADNSKLTSLQSAARSLVDTVSAKASATYTIKFSLVPFSNFVKVGSTYSNAAWIDQGGASRSSYYDAYFSTHVDRLATFTSLGVSWPGCVESRPSPYDIDDTAPTTALPDTLFVPAFHPDEPDSGTYSYYANSYLSDQSYSYDWTRLVNAAKYTNPKNKDFSNQSLYSNYPYPKGPGFLCQVQPLQRLTANYTSVKSQISAMTAAGSTNIPEGIAWGFRTLSPKGPFADGAAYSDIDTSKVMVMLTDGTNAINTFNNAAGGAYSSWGYPVSNRLGTNAGTNLRSGLDAKTRAVCDKAKAAGIKIYTIGLMIGDAAGQQLLSDCSSGAGYYYDSPSATELQAIFNEIANKITKLRISS